MRLEARGDRASSEGIRIVEQNTEGLGLAFDVVARPFDGTIRLLTVCLVIRSKSDGTGDSMGDEQCLFQSRFEATVRSVDDTPLVHPYPDHPLTSDDEEDSFRLLYPRRRYVRDWSRLLRRLERSERRGSRPFSDRPLAPCRRDSNDDSRAAAGRRLQAFSVDGGARWTGRQR